MDTDESPLLLLGQLILVSGFVRKERLIAPDPKRGGRV
jgi:hypothetical protein